MNPIPTGGLLGPSKEPSKADPQDPTLAPDCEDVIVINTAIFNQKRGKGGIVSVNPKFNREYFTQKMREYRARQKAGNPDRYRAKERANKKRWIARNLDRHREYHRLLMKVRRAKSKMAKLLKTPCQKGPPLKSQ